MSSHVVIKVVIFTVDGDQLKVFLPLGKLTQGSVAEQESLDKAVMKLCPFPGGYLEQLYTFSRRKGIEIVYYILLPHYTVTSAKNWVSVRKIKKNSFDDYEVVTYALQRLRWKVEYTNVVYSLLSEEFTLSELQRTYETILGKELDKRNFRKKILSLGIIKATGKYRKGSVARPALIYSFKERKPVMVKVFS